MATTIDRLREVLDAYGASEERWPAAEREALSALAEADPQAQALISEARALDAVLDQAGGAVGAAPDQAFGARISAGALARVRAQSDTGSAETNVVDLASQRRDRDRNAGAVRARSPHPRSQGQSFSPSRAALPVWQTIGVLAASLVLGIGVGALGLGEVALQPIADIALAETGDDPFQGLTFGGETELAEDLL